MIHDFPTNNCPNYFAIDRRSVYVIYRKTFRRLTSRCTRHSAWDTQLHTRVTSLLKPANKRSNTFTLRVHSTKQTSITNRWPIERGYYESRYKLKYFSTISTTLLYDNRSVTSSTCIAINMLLLSNAWMRKISLGIGASGRPNIQEHSHGRKKRGCLVRMKRSRRCVLRRQWPVLALSIRGVVDISAARCSLPSIEHG